MARTCDVIVFGSTGYTGRLVAEYLLKTYGANGPVKWAMGGRSHVKLEEVRAEIGAPASLPLVVADSSNAASLAAMAEQTTALITTVGPYQLYGDGVVAACAKAGTDYVDLTGESNWIAEKIRDHDAERSHGGAAVFSCGLTRFSTSASISRRKKLKTVRRLRAPKERASAAWRRYLGRHARLGHRDAGRNPVAPRDR
jgi:short subunit dehydrogenase-like uncharacterized protein